MNKRMDRNRLNIGVYHLKEYARTEAHIRDLADCGIDFVVCMTDDRPALDLFAEYGVGAILEGVLPGWWGGFTDKIGKMAELCPIELYEKAAADFADHPAVWGIDTGDEPSGLEFPHLGRIFEVVNRLFPNQFANLNLHPVYAMTPGFNYLQTENYEAYIAEYCKHIDADYICYDFYVYQGGMTAAKMYDNLRIVADACRDTGKSMWITIQVNSTDPERPMTENQLRFQAYSAMAFGAENIIWACYTAGWWYQNVLDENGEKTEQYDKLKKINGEIRTMAEAYMRFRRVDTHFIGYMPEHPDMALQPRKPVDALSIGAFRDVHGENGEQLIAGQMVSRAGDGTAALMLCGADDIYDASPKSYRILFHTDRRVKAIGPAGEIPVQRMEDGSYSIPFCSNTGVLLIAG